MAFDPLPPSWIASWSEDGTDVTFPIASIPELTAAEADAAAGDIRNVLFAMLTELYSVWAAQDSADQPDNMTMTKSVSTNTTTNVSIQTFTVRFNTEVLTQEVVAEA